MDKTYEKIEFIAGHAIDSAVEELLEYREKGILACGDFNGITLYSDTVTMDDAYKQIAGMSKLDFDIMQLKWKNQYDEREKKHKERVPELTEEWMEKGREILTEDKWEYWDKIVPGRLNDLYHGMELGCCLDIANILNNNGTLDEAKAKIESQGHSGMSFSVVCSMVKEFCERGNEFVEYVR